MSKLFSDEELDELDTRFRRATEDMFDAYSETINALEAENERLRDALEPFAHPDLRLQLGGNSDREGRDAIVFQRNNAVLRLRDFDVAAAPQDPHADIRCKCGCALNSNGVCPICDF